MNTFGENCVGKYHSVEEGISKAKTFFILEPFFGRVAVRVAL